MKFICGFLDVALKHIVNSYWSLFIYILVILGIEQRDSHLLDSHSTTWATPPEMFWSYFEVVSHFMPRTDWTVSCLFYSSSQELGKLAHATMPRFFHGDGSLTNFFCPCWPVDHSFPRTWNDRHLPLHPAIGWDDTLLMFCLCWPWTMSSGSHLARNMSSVPSSYWRTFKSSDLGNMWTKE
jgi:hypothetical protein